MGYQKIIVILDVTCCVATSNAYGLRPACIDIFVCRDRPRICARDRKLTCCISCCTPLSFYCTLSNRAVSGISINNKKTPVPYRFGRSHSVVSKSWVGWRGTWSSQRCQTWICSLSNHKIVEVFCVSISTRDANGLRPACRDILVCRDCPWISAGDRELTCCIRCRAALSFKATAYDGTVYEIRILSKVVPITNCFTRCHSIVDERIRIWRKCLWSQTCRAVFCLCSCKVIVCYNLGAIWALHTNNFLPTCDDVLVCSDWERIWSTDALISSRVSTCTSLCLQLARCDRTGACLWIRKESCRVAYCLGSWNCIRESWIGWGCSNLRKWSQARICTRLGYYKVIICLCI